MIHEKASGDTFYREFQDDKAEGLTVQYGLNGLAWFTFSKY
jgi:hypothetical protein